MGCPIVVLACNTASAKALRTIQQDDLPIIAPSNRVLGIIRPTAEVLGNITKTNKVGVLGTQGTVNSQSYILETAKLFPNIKVYQQACPLLVPIVENHEIDTPGADYFVQKYLDALFLQDYEIDTIVLGCTHYPLLLGKIRQYMPDGVHIIEQGSYVAKSLENYLTRHPEIKERITTGGTARFLTTEQAEEFQSKAAVFMGNQLEAKRVFME